jgi:hypothetical protein
MLRTIPFPECLYAECHQAECCGVVAACMPARIGGKTVKLETEKLANLTSMAFSLKLYCSLIDLMPSYQWNSTFLF